MRFDYCEYCKIAQCKIGKASGPSISSKKMHKMNEEQQSWKLSPKFLSIAEFNPKFRLIG